MPLCEGQRTRGGNVVLLSNSPQSDFQTTATAAAAAPAAPSNHAAELSHHFSAPQFTVPKTEAISQGKNAFPQFAHAPPITSQGRTLRPDPGAVVIEMIAMLFFDAVMGQRGIDSSSSPDKRVQSFP